MTRPQPEAVETRLLAAEACASAAMALVQQPAFWEALSTLALLIETIEARRLEGLYNVGEAVCGLIDTLHLVDTGTEDAVQILATVDNAARTWVAIAHPAPRARMPATTWMDHLPTVS